MRHAVRIFALGLFAARLFGGTQANYDSQQRIWNFSNGVIAASFQLTPEGHFLTRQFSDARSGETWTVSADRPTSPVRLQTETATFDASTTYDLVSQSAEPIRNGMRQSIVLADLLGRARFTVLFEMYDDQPALRYYLRYRNQAASTAYVTLVNMVPWTFADLGNRYTAMRVSQWSVLEKSGDFQPTQVLLDTGGTTFDVNSGSAGSQCGWLAVRDSDGRGLFAGWEFDGRSKTTVRQVGAKGYLQFNSSILDLHHPVAPLTEFTTPAGFLGLFHGDFDEAAYRTQRFAEAVLAKPPPDEGSFPYVTWDSWAFQAAIEEQTLRRNADIAAAMGVELFTVDLGWARAIGDWRADPAKFPNGLGALSDYVHGLGMKFGLHFALAEADAASPVLRDNPDWASTDPGSYFGARGLCLAHKPAQEWIVKEAIRMIDEYHVDWILQDGQNMVKQCSRSDHTHDPADSNYANSVEGINSVVAAIQAARPNVSWENCENGGSMMTFNMVRNYVTSITNDASGSLEARRAVYGATYPFPPRYAERYMPDSDGLTTYSTHSYRFGGPWVLMNQLTALTVDEVSFLTDQIRNYRNQRRDISAGKVFHITAPGAASIDAIQSYNDATDTGIAVVTRAASSANSYVFRPKGLKPDQRYTVWFEIATAVYSQTGAQLMSGGVRIPLPTPYSSDIVHIEPQQ
jgi:alpha-galactosidase